MYEITRNVDTSKRRLAFINKMNYAGETLRTRRVIAQSLHNVETVCDKTTEQKKYNPIEENRLSYTELKNIIDEQSIALKFLNKEVERLLTLVFEGVTEPYIKDKQVADSNTSLQNSVSENIETNPSPTILIYGISKLQKNDILKILNERFKVSFNIELTKSNVTIMTSNTMDELKNYPIVDSLKTEKYDYLIVAPHPHSIKGKNIKHSWERFLSIRKIETKVLENHVKPLSRDLLNKYILKIGTECMEKNVG